MQLNFKLIFFKITAKISVNTWNEHFDVQINNIISFENVKVSAFMGAIECTARTYTKIIINEVDHECLKKQQDNKYRRRRELKIDRSRCG